jgi:hypothetical protein
MQPMSLSATPSVMSHLHQQLRLPAAPMIKTSITPAAQLSILATWWQLFDCSKEGQIVPVEHEKGT